MSHDPDFAPLRAALQLQAPAPDPAAQSAALAVALANFDVKPRKPGLWDRLRGWQLPVWVASAMAVGVAVVVVLPPAQPPAPKAVPASQSMPVPQMRSTAALPQGLDAPVWQDLRDRLGRGERPQTLDPIAMLHAFGIADPDAVMRHVITNHPAPEDLPTQIASLARLLQGDPAFSNLSAAPLPEAPEIAALIAKARALPAP